MVLGQTNFPSLDELSFDLKYCGGAIYKHTKKVHISPPPYSQELEFSISHRTYGKRKWERINNCPTPSINFCYSKYGDELGNAFSFYPGIEWAVLRRKKLNWRFKVGGGLGLATDAWTREDTLNNYLGSRLNNFTAIQTGLNYQISKNMEIQIGGRMSHISNGAFRIPNFGINLFSGFVGVNYYPLAIPKLQREKVIDKPAKRKINIGIRSSIAWSEQNLPNGAMHPIYTQTVYAATALKKKHLFFAGVDIAKNNKALSGYKYTQQTGNLNWAATSSSVFAGAELLYGRVGLPFSARDLHQKTSTSGRNMVSKIWFSVLYLS